MPRIISFVVFMLVVVAVMGSMHWYLWTRFVRDLHLAAPWRQIFTGGMVAMLLLLTATPLMWRLFEGVVPSALMTAIYFWMGFVVIALVVVGGLDLGRLVYDQAYRFMVSTPVDEGRRLALARFFGGTAMLGAVGASVMAARSALGSPSLRKVSIALKKLPKELDKMTMVQISDLHVGPTIRRDYVDDVVDRTNALNPDVIVITGDLVDGTVEELEHDVAPLARLKARLGVYFVTGNHEYYSGVGGWMRHLPTLGIRVLRNENVRIESSGGAFYLAGVDDWTAGQFGGGHGPDLAAALADIPDGACTVLLAHQPKQVLEAAERKVCVQLSGHTHGGQIWPFGIFVRLAQPYVAGLADHQGTQIYVSRGTGFWGPPMRFGAPSELTHIELRANA